MRGTMDVATTNDLESRLRNMGLDVISYRESKSLFPSLRRGSVTRRDLISFCFHLEQQTKAGVPLIDGLRDLRDSVEGRILQEVTSSLIEQIEGGSSLSQAMETFPKIFDNIFISLIRAGERSGKLVEILQTLTENLKWQDELATQAKKALMYPAFVSVAVIGVVVALMMFLVPELVKFISSMNQVLPVHTKALIALSDLLRNYGHLLFFAVVAAVLIFGFLYRTQTRFAFFIDGLKLSMWGLGPVQRKLTISRFAHHFALLYSAGITVIECLQISEGIMGNRVLAQAVAQAAKNIGDGLSLSAAFERTNLFPRLVLRMMKVGETTGALDTALNNISYFYNRDVRDSIDRMQALIGPVMTAVLGSILCWIIVSVIGPIYNVLATVKM